ncbi:MAG: TM1802 family CRISPR-associated protein [Candidatus Heimdallarchaeaceae archaeon]
MLVSVLRNIGLATIGEKDEIDIILEEQSKKLARSPSIFVCNVNLDKKTFEINIEDMDISKIKAYLPGIVSGHSKNYSPFLALKYQKSSKEKDFRKLQPEDLLNLKKIPDISLFVNEIEDVRVLSFFRWLEANKEELCQRLHLIVEKEYTEEKDNGQVGVTKNAPKFIVFKIDGLFPGEIESFRNLFLLQKSYSTKKKGKVKSKKESVEVICISCGEKKEEMIPLEKCSFFKFFSIDQLYFQLGFDNNAKQAMICRDCELLVRQGYTELDTSLKFEAYKIKIKESKYKYVKHSILPLTSNKENIQKFIKNLLRYRTKVYESKKETLRSKLEELQSHLEKADKSKRAKYRAQLKKLEKELRELEKSGEIKGSSDIGLRELLEQAAENHVGIIDFYYEDQVVAGNPKKVVEDFIYGERNQVEKIVELLKETDKHYYNQIVFNFGHLIEVFGEKNARLIIQSLFTGKKIDRKVLYKAAYNNLWLMFRETYTKKDENSSFRKYQVSRGKEIFHYTMTLLKKSEILR